MKGLGDGGFETLFDGGFAGMRILLSQPWLRPANRVRGDPDPRQGWGTRHLRCGGLLVNIFVFQQDAVDDGFDGVVLALVERGGSEGR